MAYLSLVEYDQGGTIRSLDGLAAVTYDDGATRNLLGAQLGAVKYDDGGRFRTLVGHSERLPARGAFAFNDGLGQDTVDIPPPDVGLDPSLTASFPIDFAPPSPVPSMLPFIPAPTVDTTSTPVTGTLVDTGAPSSAAGLVNAPAPTSILTSIFSGIRSIASGIAPSTPKTAGLTVPLPGQPGYVAPAGTSWFSQSSALGVPNWGLLAGVGVLGLGLMAAMRGGSGGGSSRRNPARR